ncbi:non-hemolytic phospholipase C precursor [Mucor ambiguus]|uniref:Non-hemolytic phospholipase C n=1 Tax=Mucor ambiguus TaxID=91626 RepID=A0A0C9LPU1_9FUNG|nr:non-hemolytic phospholipase C precursor [Mucor ambiguus]
MLNKLSISTAITMLVMATCSVVVDAAPATHANKAAADAVTSATRIPGLEKIKHIVYFMQENRSFDNYYGTMSGVRGFADPNIGIQDNGLNLLYQPCSKSTDVKNGTKYLLPYHLEGQRAGCTGGGSNGWSANHKALNNGKNNNWPDGNSPNSMGYLNRSQIPFLYSLADEFTIADMYFQSVTGPTNPNRVVWMSGTNRGAPNDYVLEDNTESTPLEWSTYPEMLTKANTTWQLYQDKDNFDDNPLAWFKYWQKLPAGAEKNKGVGFLGLQAFYDAAAAGTLPAFSIIVGPTELSEHPNNTPLAGSWLQQQVVNAVMKGKNWKDTALFINYDESGGYFDHVIPPQAPSNEWVTDKFDGGKVPIGFGPRVPMVIVSPWTRGGNVYSEVSDHTSTLKFMEEWVGKDNATGKYLAPAENISPWARSTSSNLINAFDFENPDYSIPTFAPVPKPAQVLGKWAPTEMCEAIITAPKTSPPYGKQVYPTVEAGARLIRGAVTEGRKLAFQTADGMVLHLSTDAKKMQVQKLQKRAGKPTFAKNALFNLVKTGNDKQFKMQSVANPSICLNVWGSGLDLGECKGTSWYFQLHDGHYHVRDVGTDSYLSVKGGNVNLTNNHETHYKVYSVTE